MRSPAGTPRRGLGRLSPKLAQSLFERRRGNLQVAEEPPGRAVLLAQHAQQDVLVRDPVVSEPGGLTQRTFERLLGLGREGNPPIVRYTHLERPARLPAHRVERDPDRRERLCEHPFGLLSRVFECYAQRRERLGAYPLLCAEDSQQKVLVAHRVMTQHPGFFVGGFHTPASSIDETDEPHAPLPFLLGGSPGYLSLIRLACFLWTACLLTPN